MKAIITLGMVAGIAVCGMSVETGLAEETSNVDSPTATANTRIASPGTGVYIEAMNGAVDRTAERLPRAAATATAYEEVAILLDGAVTIEEVRALPQAPGTMPELFADPARIVAQLPSGVVSQLVARGANVMALRDFFLIEANRADSPGDDGEPMMPVCSGDYRFGENGSNVSIPDDGSWVYSTIFISGAPGGSTVNCIDVHYEISHEWVEDLDIDLNDQDFTYNHDLWGPDDGWGSDLDETELGITTFNGEPVNQTWILWARDVYPNDVGYIDYWWIKVYYQGGGGEQPDLIVEDSSRSPGVDVHPGDSISLSDAVLNQGDAAAGSSFYVTWFISIDSNVTTSDYEWGYRYVSCCLGPGVTSGVFGSIPWPDVAPYNTPGQTYYVAVMADDLDEVGESNEDNNWGETWPVTLFGSGDCCNPPLESGDRVRLLVDAPSGAENLPAGRCGTVVCCDSDDPDLPILVSWENWSDGHNDDSFCDDPPGPFPDGSGWWVGCADIVHDEACECPPPPAVTDPTPSDDASCVPVETELCWNPGGRTVRVIYGDDDRLDVYEVTEPALQAVTDSTMALIDTSRLTDNGNGTYSVSAHPTLAETIEYWYGDPLCGDEPFYDQPTHASCSGVLVGEDLIATAGHCIVDTGDCAATAFVFGFEMIDASTPALTFPASDVYFCNSIVDRVLDPAGADWGIIQLDRLVTGRTPLSVRRAGTVPNGEPLVLIGHPVGLPTKVAGGATVRSNSHADYFQANVDAYGGNSGSPVLNAVNLQVEGLLVRGNTDFVLTGEDCVASNWCQDTGCPYWEDVTRATEFDHLVPELPQMEYDVRFGPCVAVELLGTTTETCWPLPELDPNTEYCWSVTTRNRCGGTTSPPAPAYWSFTTSPGAMVLTLPHNCEIDARQPHAINNPSIQYGWDYAEITFDCDPSWLGASDFVISQTNPAPAPPDIASANAIGGNTLALQLDGPMNPGNWTCFALTAHPDDKRCLGYLPADANGDRTSAPADVLTVIDGLNGVIELEDWQSDMDRDGTPAPADILRVIDLLNGAGTFDPWINVQLPPCPAD